MVQEPISSKFFDAHPEPMWIYDIETLAILAVNDAAVAKYGYTRAEFLGLTIADIRPPEDVESMEARLQAGTESLRLAGTWRHRLKSGEDIDVEIISHTIDYQGRRARLVLARDVSRLVELERGRAAAERLRVQDANLRTAQRLLGLGFWSLDLDSGVLTWSDEVYPMYGVRPGEFDGSFEAYVALVHPDDKEQMLTSYEAFMASGEPHFYFEHRVQRSSGGTKHVRGVGELTEQAGRRTLIGVVEDITGRKQSEIAVRESEAQLRLAGEIARLGAWRVELESETVFWSDETAAIHGLPPGTQPNLAEAFDYYAPEYQDRIRECFERCASEGTPFDETLEILPADGSRIWVRALGEAERDGSGRIQAVRGALQDITDLMTAREAVASLDRRLRATLDSISDAFITLDPQWRFIFVNHQAERLFARSRDEILGRSVWAEFPEAVGSTFEAEYRRAVAKRETAHFTEYFAPLEMWLEVSAYPVDAGLAVYFQDVTAERAREEQLRLLEAAVSHQADILLITEADSIDSPAGPKIVYVNDAFVRRTGYSRDEVIGRTPRLLQGPATQREELDRIRRALVLREPVRAELINYTRSGEPFWLEVDIVPLIGEFGTTTHFVAVERDITARRDTEEAMRLNEERFHVVAKATKDVIWDWNVLAGTVWYNEALTDIFGYDPGEIEPGPESWSNLIHPDDRNSVLESVRAVLESSDNNWESEYRFLNSDGAARTVIDRGYVIRDAEGRAVRMVGSMIDVTERRELEERVRQSQKLEAVGQLTGGIAHDFNNLLTVILGNAEQLGEQLEGRQDLRSLARITVDAAQRGSELTRRLLAFARRQTLAPQRINANRLIAEIDELLRRTLHEDIEIEFVRADGLWQIEADRSQLESALLNLAINARDAMPGGGRLTIETRNTSIDDDYANHHHDVAAGQYVRISVSDTGTGMPEDVAARAFDPFFSTKPAGQGTGLGLSMVYGFVKQSGGHAQIYSEFGEGTVVELYFPKADSAGKEAEPVREEAETAGGHEHILVVEDDELVRSYVVRQLGNLGYRVTSAPSGPAALAALDEHDDIDLLFTDVVMPGGMNGRELADAARQRRPDLRVLFTSGYTETAIVHEGRLDEGVELLGKPYRRRDLAERIRQLLDAPANGR